MATVVQPEISAPTGYRGLLQRRRLGAGHVRTEAAEENDARGASGRGAIGQARQAGPLQEFYVILIVHDHVPLWFGLVGRAIDYQAANGDS